MCFSFVLIVMWKVLCLMVRIELWQWDRDFIRIRQRSFPLNYSPNQESLLYHSPVEKPYLKGLISQRVLLFSNSHYWPVVMLYWPARICVVQQTWHSGCRNTNHKFNLKINFTHNWKNGRLNGKTTLRLCMFESLNSL